MANVTIDLSAPAYRITPGDAEVFKKTEGSEDDAVIRAAVSRTMLRSVVQAKYPQGMDGKDGRRWARIANLLLDDTLTIELGRDDFDWLHKTYTDENVKIAASAQSWRVTLEDYLDALKDAARKGDKDGANLN